METQQPNNEQRQSSNNSMDELPKDTHLGAEMVNYQGFWIWSFRLQPILSFQTHFKAESTDIFIIGMPKTGHTWLKSLVFSILYRHQCPILSSPLLHHNSHDLIPHLEIGPYTDDPSPDLSKVLKFHGSPRLLTTHLPYQSLPESIKNSRCKIIYICRNPLDTFVSWYFFTKGVMEKINKDVEFLTMEESFELYLQGIIPYGPFFDHVLGYWENGVNIPDKVLFIKYEELIKDAQSQLKRIGEFVSLPFSIEEEEDGIIEEIINLSSIKSLKDLKVNKEGNFRRLGNNLFFRKGEVGDYINHLTPSMIDRMRETMHQRFDGFDELLSFCDA